MLGLRFARARTRQGETAGDAATRGYLWGAGLTVRASAWQALRARGFEMSRVGPRGAAYTGGDDIALRYALGLGGWRLWYDPRLRFRHFIRAARLQWAHLRQRCYGWGWASVSLDLYLMAAGTGSARRLLLRCWSWRLVAAAGRLLWRGVLENRRTWHANRRRVRDAAWRRPSGASR